MDPSLPLAGRHPLSASSYMPAAGKDCTTRLKSQTGVIRREVAVVELLRIACTRARQAEGSRTLVTIPSPCRSLIGLGENTSTFLICPGFVLHLVLINHVL